MMESSNKKIQEVGRNIQEKAALVWSVADDLVGAFKPHEYGLVVLPMAVIKRFHDCLLPTHDKVRETYQNSMNCSGRKIDEGGGVPCYH